MTRGRPPSDDVLTPAEWRVVHYVRHGMSDRVIAQRLGVSLDAVKFHVGNARGKLGLQTRAALRLWPGVPRHSALAAERPAMTDPLVLGPLGQISRKTRDVHASTAFYRDLLGLPHLYTFGTLAFFDLGGLRLFLEEDTSEPLDDTCLYFRVPDIRQAHARMGERGVSFVDAPHMIHRHADGTEEWMAFFRDPEGRLLAIMQQAKPLAGA